MTKKQDFSKGQRGRFYRKDAILNLPIYLDKTNRQFVEEAAQRRNVDSSTVVNNLIRTNRKILKAVE